jgi:hypothetical protein
MGLQPICLLHPSAHQELATLAAESMGPDLKVPAAPVEQARGHRHCRDSQQLAVEAGILDR